MIKYTTLETDDSTYKLSALLNEKNEFTMPSLQKMIENEEVFFWDNDNFLYNNFFAKLSLYNGDKDLDFKTLFSFKVEGEEELIIFIEESDVEGLLEIFQEASRLGFFNEARQKSLNLL